ncbi:hypothetical protein HYX14_06755 [Candidatus Woesearchaeota archaeon]|nr:hypothetical protein [Candidatus Woesearchaeota archaeon]
MDKTIPEINKALDGVVEDLDRKRNKLSMPNAGDMQKVIYEQSIELAKSYLQFPENEARRTMERIQLVRYLWQDYIQRVRFEELKKPADH